MKRALYIGGGLAAAGLLFLWWKHRRSPSGFVGTAVDAQVIPIHGRTGEKEKTVPTAPIHGRH